MHVARDLVDRVVAPDVLEIDQNAILFAQGAAVDRARLEVEGRNCVDLAHEGIQPGCSDHGVFRQLDLIEPLHKVAERSALRAAGGTHLLLQLGLEIRRPLGPHDHELEFLVVLDGTHHVVRPQHVLVQQIAEREIVRVVADRHHGDDLLPVQEQGQRPLVDDGGLDRAAGLVDAGDGLRQARVLRVGEQQGLAHDRPFPSRCVAGLT
jgi:hypothetical protein